MADKEKKKIHELGDAAHFLRMNRLELFSDRQRKKKSPKKKEGHRQSSPITDERECRNVDRPEKGTKKNLQNTES